MATKIIITYNGVPIKKLSSFIFSLIEKSPIQFKIMKDTDMAKFILVNCFRK